VTEIATVDIGGGQVTTPTIAANAATNTVSHTGGGGASTTSITYADISGETITINVSAAGSSVLVTWTASVSIFNFTGALDQVQVSLKLVGPGGTLVTALLSSLLVDSGGHTAPVALSFVDTGVSGSSTYKIQWHLNISSCQAILANESVLSATELKR
jgi:hypothetical protein